jgi:hypothetical protein
MGATSSHAITEVRAGLAVPAVCSVGAVSAGHDEQVSDRAVRRGSPGGPSTNCSPIWIYCAIITHVTEVRVWLIIGVGVFEVIGSLVTWLLVRRRAARWYGLWAMIGVPGIFLVFLAQLWATGWLYIPGLLLVCFATFLALRQVRSMERRARSMSKISDDLSSSDSDSPA